MSLPPLTTPEGILDWLLVGIVFLAVVLVLVLYLGGF